VTVVVVCCFLNEIGCYPKKKKKNLSLISRLGKSIRPFYALSLNLFKIFFRLTSSAAKTCKIYRRMTDIILPQELITEVLSLLLVKPLLRFQCVSKAWFVVINDPDFIRMHLNRSIETNRERALIADVNNRIQPQTYYSVNFSDKQRFSDPEGIYRPFNYPITTLIKIVGHCNGLVCLHICPSRCSIEERNKYPDEIVIWNPLIRRYKKLPFKPIENPVDYELAFGYDQINDDYKVVRILKPLFASVAEVGHHVYSLRGNSWRKVEDKWPDKDLYLHSDCSASLNGALHWVAGRSGLTSSLNAALHWVDGRSGLTSTSIIAFDLSTEKFRVHALPIETKPSNTFGGLGRMSVCLGGQSSTIF
jgi:F-box interacting protein